MSRQHLSREETELRAVVTQWLGRAISVEQAKAKKLVPLSNKVFLHQWEQRIELFRFAQRSAHARPVLVQPRQGVAVLYTERRPTIH